MGKMIEASEGVDKWIGRGCLAVWILFHTCFAGYALRNFFHEQAKVMRASSERMQDQKQEKTKASALFVDDSGLRGENLWKIFHCGRLGTVYWPHQRPRRSWPT